MIHGLIDKQSANQINNEQTTGTNARAYTRDAREDERGAAQAQEEARELEHALIELPGEQDGVTYSVPAVAGTGTGPGGTDDTSELTLAQLEQRAGELLDSESPYIVVALNAAWGQDADEFTWTPRSTLAADMLAAGARLKNVCAVCGCDMTTINQWTRNREFCKRVEQQIESGGVASTTGQLFALGGVAEKLYSHVMQSFDPVAGKFKGIELKDAIKLLFGNLDQMRKTKQFAAGDGSEQRMNTLTVNFIQHVENMNESALKKTLADQRRILDLMPDGDGGYGV